MKEKMFSKRHYIQLAETLRTSKDLTEFEENLISLFKCDNERFSEWKFREALKV